MARYGVKVSYDNLPSGTEIYCDPLNAVLINGRTADFELTNEQVALLNDAPQFDLTLRKGKKSSEEAKETAERNAQASTSIVEGGETE